MIPDAKNPEGCRELIAHYNSCDEDRSVWKSHMGEIATLTRQLRNELTGTTGSPGEKRMSRVFDGTAIKGAQNLGAGLYGLASNPADRWFKLGTLDEDRNKFGPNREWLERTTSQVLASFGPYFGAFYAQAQSFYLDLASFGTAVFTSEIRPDHSGFVDRCRSLSSTCIDVDGEGNVDTLFRKWCMSSSAAIKLFDKDNVSSRTRECADAGNDEEREFLQYIGPNADYVDGRIGPAGKPVTSIYLEVDVQHEISRGGFWDLPFQCCRWEVADGEIYGRGPGETALPDTKSLNVMAKANLKAGEQAADPTLAAYSKESTPIIRAHPGKVVYGGLDRAGNQLVKPIFERGDTPFSLEMAEALRTAIKEYFYFSLLPVMNRTGLAPIETLERQETNLRLMAPYLGRINGEFLLPAVMLRYRRLLMVRDANNNPIIQPPPPDLAGHALQVMVDSPMAQAQKSARAAGVLRFEQSAASIFARNPMAAAKVNDDRSLEVIAEGYGVETILNDDDTTNQNRQQLQQMAAAQQAVETAKTGSEALRNGAQAQAATQNANAAQPA